MPVVPRFTLSQTDNTLTLTVHLPYIRITNLELDIHDNTVSIYCQPYLLKLALPGSLQNDENEEETLPSTTTTIVHPENTDTHTLGTAKPTNTNEGSRAEYDPTKDNGTLTLILRKAVPGQIFENLDMITRLLQPSSSSSLSTDFPSTPSPHILQHRKKNQGKEIHPRQGPLIEVLDSHDFSKTEGNDDDLSPDETTETEETNTLASLSVPSVYTTTASTDNTNSSSFPSSSTLPTYGFQRNFYQFFIDLKEEIQSSVVQIPEPDTIPNSLRPLLRVAAENTAWDPERYIGDYMDGEEDPLYQEAIRYVPFWLENVSSILSKDTVNSKTNEWVWTKEEMQELASLPNKEFLIDNILIGGKHRIVKDESSTNTNTTTPVTTNTSTPPTLPFQPSSSSPFFDNTVTPDTCPPETHRLLLGLITILFGYCYDYRLTMGEHNVESSWTITTLSPLLSWLDDEYIVQNTATLSSLLASSPSSVSSLGGTTETNTNEETLSMIFKQLNIASSSPPSPSSTSTPSPVRPTVAHAAVACIRRCLLYPYLRRMDLALLVIMDIATLFLHGPRMILKCLLKIKHLYHHEENKYLLNTLFINDYCVWIQSIFPTILMPYGQDLTFIGSHYSTKSIITTTINRTNDEEELSPRQKSLLQILTEGLQEWKLEIIEERARNGEDIYSSEEEEEEEDDSSDNDSDSNDNESTSSSGSETEEDDEGNSLGKLVLVRPKTTSEPGTAPLIEELN